MHIFVCLYNHRDIDSINDLVYGEISQRIPIVSHLPSSAPQPCPPGGVVSP